MCVLCVMCACACVGVCVCGCVFFCVLVGWCCCLVGWLVLCCVSVWLWLWCVVCVCGVCKVQNALRVYVQNVPVCTGTTPACGNTCARGASTHGDVLNVHTARSKGQRDTHTHQHHTHATQEQEKQEKQDACFLSSLSLHLVNTLFLFSTTMTMITGSLVVCGMWVKCLCVACCCCLMFCVMCVVVGLCCADIQSRRGYLDESHGFSCRSPALVLNFSPL